MTTALRSSVGTGRYAASEGDVQILSKLWTADGSKRGVIFCHGVNATAAQAWSPGSAPNLFGHIAAIAQAGYPVLSIDAGGTSTWGNDTAKARITDARTYLQGTLGAKSGKVLLVGWSMGGCNALTWAASNPSLVAAVAVFQPIADLGDVKASNRGGYAAVIDTAYGGTYDDTANGPTHSPVKQAASLAGIPVRIHSSSGDTTAVPATHSALAAGIGASATLVSSAGTHGDAALGSFSASALVAFLDANA